MRVLRKRRGFTLLELLIVISIIGLLAGLTMIAISQAKRRAHISKAESEVRELLRAWHTYWITFEEWPASLKTAKNAPMTWENLRHISGDNNQGLYFIDAGPKAKDEGMLDPWGNPYLINFDATSTEGTEEFEACISFPNQRRYTYDDI